MAMLNNHRVYIYNYIYNIQLYINGGFLKWEYPYFSSIYRCIFPEINHPFLGTPILGTPIYIYIYDT